MKEKKCFTQFIEMAEASVIMTRANHQKDMVVLLSSPKSWSSDSCKDLEIIQITKPNMVL
jgi:hypothetical protein